MGKARGGGLAIDIGHLVAGVLDSEASTIGGRVELDSLKGEHRLRRLSQVSILDEGDAGAVLVVQSHPRESRERLEKAAQLLLVDARR